MRKSLKSILVVFLFCISISGWAQQGLQMESLAPDSTQIELEKQTLYRQLLSGEMAPGLFMDDLKLNDFDFNGAFASRYRLNKSIYPEKNFVIVDNSSIMNYSFATPVQMYGTVFSSAAHQIGDKLVIGGMSYGANSIFSAPLPNRGMNAYDIRGNTLFLQYKVSKNFKIETRVNVNNSHGPGF